MSKPLFSKHSFFRSMLSLDPFACADAPGDTECPQPTLSQTVSGSSGQILSRGSSPFLLLLLVPVLGIGGLVAAISGGGKAVVSKDINAQSAMLNAMTTANIPLHCPMKDRRLILSRQYNAYLSSKALASSAKPSADRIKYEHLAQVNSNLYNTNIVFVGAECVEGTSLPRHIN